MPGISTFGSDDILPTVRFAWLYTLSRLLKSPYTASFVPSFQAIGPSIDAAIQTQGALDDGNLIAKSGRDGADGELDPLLWQIINTLLVITKNDRHDPLFVSYVGSQTPGAIVRPLLGAELVTAAQWVASLEQETDPLLQAFAKPLAAVVALGQAAEKEVKASEKALSDFRLLGERKKVIDALNAARGELLGALVKFQHENTHLRLPSDWPMGFFQHATKSAKYGDTVEEAEESLTRLAEEKAAAQANLQALQEKAAARDSARATRAQARLDLAAARKEAREKRQAEKALEAAAKKKL